MHLCAITYVVVYNSCNVFVGIWLRHIEYLTGVQYPVWIECALDSAHKLQACLRELHADKWFLAYPNSMLTGDGAFHGNDERQDLV